MMEYTAVNIRLENRESIDGLTDEDAGALFKALMCHGDGGDVDRAALPYGARTLYPIIAGQIDRARASLDDIAAKRSAGGKKGMATRWGNRETITSDNKTITSDNNAITPDNSVITPDNKGITKISKPNPNPKPIPNIDIEKEKLKQKERTDLRRGVLEDEAVYTAFTEWIKMRARLKKPLTDRAADMAVNRLNKMTADPAQALAIIEQSIFHNWLDFYELKNDTPRNGRGPINWEAV